MRCDEVSARAKALVRAKGDGHIVESLVRPRLEQLGGKRVHGVDPLAPGDGHDRAAVRGGVKGAKGRRASVLVLCCPIFFHFYA